MQGLSNWGSGKGTRHKKICLQDARLSVFFSCLVWVKPAHLSHSLVRGSRSGQTSTWTLSRCWSCQRPNRCVFVSAFAPCHATTQAVPQQLWYLVGITHLCFRSTKYNFFHLPAWLASASLLVLMPPSSGSKSATSPCSLSGSSGDSSRSWSPACRRETIPPALSPPLGIISRQHRASRAADAVTAWIFIPAALPTRTILWFGVCTTAQHSLQFNCQKVKFHP